MILIVKSYCGDAPPMLMILRYHIHPSSEALAMSDVGRDCGTLVPVPGDATVGSSMVSWSWLSLISLMAHIFLVLRKALMCVGP